MPKHYSGLPGRVSIIDGWSIEATLPRLNEVRTLAQLVGPDKEVYLSTLPHVSIDQQIETARIVRSEGLDPVPHIAATRVRDITTSDRPEIMTPMPPGPTMTESVIDAIEPSIDTTGRLGV